MGESCIIATITIEAWRWVPIEARLPFVAATFEVDTTLTLSNIRWFRKTLVYELYGPKTEVDLFIRYIEGDTSWIKLNR